MNEEANCPQFSLAEKKDFEERLKKENALLMELFSHNKFEDPQVPSCGLELEGWLVDSECNPAPKAESFLGKVNDPLAVPEISKFNFELNAPPVALEGSPFSTLHHNLKSMWGKCQDAAASVNTKALMIGSLPTLTKDMLSLKNMYPSPRYHALNESIMSQRTRRSIDVQIAGRENLAESFPNVMLESAATSFQIHLQVPPSMAKEYYNASLLISAFSAAIGANSPFLFGKTLWSETRIPIFEQAVHLDGSTGKPNRFDKRVTFGDKYLNNCLSELFVQNLESYPVILPFLSSEAESDLEHLKLHNGTIWRWNRPIIGSSDNGVPHLRIEHRTPPAGPTPVDMIANMAFYIGAVRYLAKNWDKYEKSISFQKCHDNFYNSCQFGLESDVHWLNGKKSIQSVLVNELIDAAHTELLSMNLDVKELDFYFYEVLKPRTQSKQNASNWQREFVKTNGHNYKELLERYFEYQEKDIPVFQWRL